MAVVVATDRYLARDAADAIVVEIEELPAVIDTEGAMIGEPAILHEAFENNLAVPLAPAGTGVNPETLEVEDETAIEQAFERADVVVSQRIVNQRLVPNAIEPRGVIAHYEPGKDELTAWLTTQNPHIARTLLAAVLGLGQHQVRVIAPDVGGGFGSKINVYGEDFVAAAVSRVLGKPVKWIEDRSEAFMTTIHGRDIIGYVDIAATSEGKVLGLKIRMIADIGAYEMVLTAAIPTLSAFMLSGVYEIGAVRCDLTEVFTNKMPTDAYRGAGRPEGIFFVERAMDLLARELDLDPAELRRRNFIQPEQFPYTTAGGMVYDSGEYERALDLALENAGWEQMKADRDAARAEGRVVGIGLSFYTEICGFGPSAAMPTVGLWEYGSVSVERDGKVRATTGASSHGQGHETTFSQLLADEFGVPIDDITIVHGDTGQVRAGTGTFGSRSMAVGGTAILHAAEKVKDKMRRFGAQMMELPPDDLEFRAGMIGPRGAEDTGVSFAEVAAFAYIPLPLPPDTEPGAERGGLLGARGLHVAVRLLHLSGRARPRHRRTGVAALHRRRRLRQHHQPADRDRTDPRRYCPGRRPGLDRRGRLRHRWSAGDRLIHGLCDAAGARLPSVRAGPHDHAFAAQPDGRQGRGGGRDHRFDPMHRQRRGRRPRRVRRDAHRHDAAPGEALARDQRR